MKQLLSDSHQIIFQNTGNGIFLNTNVIMLLFAKTVVHVPPTFPRNLSQLSKVCTLLDLVYFTVKYLLYSTLLFFSS